MATTGILELGRKVDSFISKGMLVDQMPVEQINFFREKECAEVMVHGQTTGSLSIEGLERKFQHEIGLTRVTVPSQDILEHSSRALPLHVTTQDAMEELTNLFKAIYNPRADQMKQEEENLDSQLQARFENKQTLRETTRNILKIFEDIVVVELSNSIVKTKLLREIGEALQYVGVDVQKTTIIGSLQKTLQEGAERDMFNKSKNAKLKWGALINRRGQLGENKTAAAVNQALEGYVGMSVMGMKTFTYLEEFLEKLNIQLTYCNARNPVTGKIQKTKEVEHDNISTWLEQDTLVVNMIESKTTEIKPWLPDDKGRQIQAAIKHANHALLQVEKDFITFKELFPDLLLFDLKNIRCISVFCLI